LKFDAASLNGVVVTQRNAAKLEADARVAHKTTKAADSLLAH